MTRTKVSDEAYKVIAECEDFHNTGILDLRYSNLTQNAVKYLCNSEYQRGLKNVEFNFSSWNAEWMQVQTNN
jgi:hypothetical protein